MNRKIGIVQAETGLRIKDNLRTVQKYCSLAKARECQILCFPEAYLTGYLPKKVSERTLSLESEEIKQVLELAKEYDMDLLLGFMEKLEDRFYLTQGIFLANGSVEVYRKTHLGQREKLYFSEGEELKVFQLSCGIKIGIQLCVENHFPEIAQTLSLKGAEMIFAPYAVPGTINKREEVWKKIMPARSYDNRVYMVCSNLWDNNRFEGGCMVTDPMGEIKAGFFEKKEKLITFLYETEMVSMYHQSDASMSYRYYPQYRRPELYI